MALALAADPCPVRVEPATLSATLDRAEAAYRALDLEAFRGASDEVSLRAPCLTAPLDPPLAARLHRLDAARRWATDPAAARASGQAALRADPSTSLADLVGSEHPLARLEAPQAAPVRRLDRPAGATLWLDGQPTRERPVELPVWFQLDGDALGTRLLAPGDPAPSYPRVPPARGPLRWGALGAGVLAGGLYGLAWAEARTFRQGEGLDAETLRAHRAAANGALVGSGVALGAGMSCLGLSWVVR